MLHSFHSSHGEPRKATAEVLTRRPGLCLCTVESSSYNHSFSQSHIFSLTHLQKITNNFTLHHSVTSPPQRCSLIIRTVALLWHMCMCLSTRDTWVQPMELKCMCVYPNCLHVVTVPSGAIKNMPASKRDVTASALYHFHHRWNHCQSTNAS